MKSTTSERILQYEKAGNIPDSTYVVVFDKNKHYLGSLCRREHEHESTGLSVRGSTHRNCIVCMKLNALVWRYENIDRAREKNKQYEATPEAKEKKRQAFAKWKNKPDSVVRMIVWGAQQRSIKKNLKYNITPEYCIELLKEQDGRCFWSGIVMEQFGPDRHPLKMSLDRLIPSDGYVIGNTNFMNRAKSDTLAPEFFKVVEKMFGSYDTKMAKAYAKYA